MRKKELFRKLRSLVKPPQLNDDGALNVLTLLAIISALPLLSKLAHSVVTHECVTNKQEWSEVEGEYNTWLHNEWSNWIEWADWKEWCEWGKWGNGG